MSLMLKIELDKLQQEEASLYDERSQLHSSVVIKIIDELKSDAEAYFKELGLTPKKNMDKVVFSASGKDWVSIDYSGLNAAGAGIQKMDISYDGKEFFAQLLIDKNEKIPNQGMISGTESEILQKKISFYKEKSLPVLRESATKQLPGTYSLILVRGGHDNKTYRNMRALLDSITG